MNDPIHSVRLALVLVGGLAAACGALPPPVLYSSTSPLVRELVAIRGEPHASGLALAYQLRCSTRRTDYFCRRSDPTCDVLPETLPPETVACPEVISHRPPHLVTPWGASIDGRVGPDRLEFDLAWATAPIDPLLPATPARLRQPWRLTLDGTDGAWRPEADEADAIVAEVAASRGVALEVRPEPNPIALRVTALAVDGGELIAGGTRSLAVTITNDGPGTAYRVALAIRSDNPALHGLRLAFGKLEPGASMQRSLPIAIGADTTDRSTIVALLFEEANHVVDATFSRRLAIARLPREPAGAFQLACRLDRPDVHARAPVAPRRSVSIRCQVENTTGRARRDVTALVDNGTTRSATTFDVLPDGRTELALTSAVPASASTGDAVRFTVSIPSLGAHGLEAVVAAKVEPDDHCAGTRLSRDEYEQKRQRLQRALDSGALTQDEFDQYVGELVACLA